MNLPPSRACCARLFCWCTGGEEGRVCRGKLRGGKGCFEYWFVVLPGYHVMLAREKMLPSPGTLFLPRLPQQHTGSVFSTDVLSWKIICSPLLKGLCALFFVCLWPFNDDLGCSLLPCPFLTGIFNCSLSLPVSLLLLVLIDFTLQFS